MQNEAPVRSRLPYPDMCIQAFETGVFWNIAAAMAAWVTVAGFLVLPTSTVLKGVVDAIDQKTRIAIGPLAGAIFCCVLGTSLSFYIWLRKRGNHVWTLQNIFM